MQPLFFMTCLQLCCSALVKYRNCRLQPDAIFQFLGGIDMRKNLTEIVFILDRSGSMSGLEKDTIGGFNSMIRKQKKIKGEALVSTVLFDNEIQVLHDRMPLDQIEKMTEEQYLLMCDKEVIEV